MEKLSLLSFLTSLELLMLLFSILLLPINIKTINSPKEIAPLENNQKISIQGVVIQEKPSSKTTLLTLDSNISFRIPNADINYTNKSIIAQGIITSFYENKTLSINKIKIIK